MLAAISFVITAAGEATELAPKESGMVALAVVVITVAMLSNMLPSCVNNHYICYHICF